jgi:GntR family transcriptional regulator
MRKIVTHNLEAEPIFTLLEQRYDIPLVDAEYELEVISADHEVAAALGAARERSVFPRQRTQW